MTIYIPQHYDLPKKQMEALAPNAACTVKELNGVAAAYEYQWPDMKVVIHLHCVKEDSDDIKGLIGWTRHLAQLRQQPIDKSLEDRIRSTNLILGFVVEEKSEQAEWYERVQEMIGMICFNTKALLLWEGELYDENCNQLIGQ